MSNIDWLSIRNEYINTNISYRKLAEKYSVSFSALEKRARREEWKIEREKQGDKIQKKVRQKTADKIVAKEVRRIEKIVSLADSLTQQAEQAITELNKHMLVNEVKTKSTAISTKGQTIETTMGSKSIDVKEGLVKVNALKQIADALKVIKELQPDAGDEDKQEGVTIVDDI